MKSFKFKVQNLLHVTLFSSLFFLFFVSDAHAEIKINEFSSGNTSDWVEVYNEGTSSEDLSSYRLRDNTASNKKDLSGTIDAGGFVSFAFSDSLNNAGDKVKLIKLNGTDETILEEIAYGDQGGVCKAEDGQSIGRQPNGSGNVVKFASQTRDSSNNSASVASCASPTPTLSPSPSPSPSPVATARPTPSPTRSPTPTPAPARPSLSPSSKLASPRASTKAATPEPEPSAEVLSENTEPSPDDSPSPTASPSASGGGIALALGLMLGGTTLSAVAGYLGYRKFVLTE